MSIIRPGPWELRFLIVNTKLNELLFLTSNGIGNVVTVEPQNLTPSDRQKVRLDIISAWIIDRPHYSGLLGS